MLIVIALGGNALLCRNERPDESVQEERVAEAARAIAPLVARHRIVLTHGNGPQIGVLAVESSNDTGLSGPFTLDALGAQSDGMIGYWLVQQLRNEIPGIEAVCVLTQTLVDPTDPAFTAPTKFIGTGYDEPTARELAARYGWVVRRDGPSWRRVVASPEPRDILELDVVRLLVDRGIVPVCAGGGGIPVVQGRSGRLGGAEAVVDKDLTAALLASRLGADALLLLTDVSCVQADWGTPRARPLRRVGTGELDRMHFAAGSMAPKIRAASRFARGGGTAGIGALTDAAGILTGAAGTLVVRDDLV